MSNQNPRAAVYRQIEQFNAAPFRPQRPNSRARLRAYGFMPFARAHAAARFLRHLRTHDHLPLRTSDEGPTLLDLTFGGGNLAATVALEAVPDYASLLLNDAHPDRANEELVGWLPRTRIASGDVLRCATFPRVRADLVLFDPPTGRGAPFRPERTVVYDGTLTDWLTQERGVDIDRFSVKTDGADRSLFVHSSVATKPELRDWFSGLRIFNYYDVFYQSRRGKGVGKPSNVVRFRQTFDTVFRPEGAVLFHGSARLFRTLFADFTNVHELTTDAEDGHVFVARKTGRTQHRRYTLSTDMKFTEIRESNYAEGTPTVPLVAESGADYHTNPPTAAAAPEFRLDLTPDASRPFPLLNVLLKGVPGVGKSRRVDRWISEHLHLTDPEATLRLNIHGASTNADLMRGVGVSTNAAHQVEYHEKRGLVLRHLERALRQPNRRFAVVLEEIQENSLNELIGDLIYLIEPEKRTDVAALFSEEAPVFPDAEALIDEILRRHPAAHRVEVPYLVANETRYRRLIFPANLHLFCTSNYRDDKRIIEDNLLRRFDVLELYPQYDEGFADAAVAAFLRRLNERIHAVLRDREIHPDRFLIGHANWLAVTDRAAFTRALLKVITEFKDVRELEWAGDARAILHHLTYPFGLDAAVRERDGYRALIEFLQQTGYGEVLG